MCCTMKVLSNYGALECVKLFLRNDEDFQSNLGDEDNQREPIKKVYIANFLPTLRQ